MGQPEPKLIMEEYYEWFSFLFFFKKKDTAPFKNIIALKYDKDTQAYRLKNSHWTK